MRIDELNPRKRQPDNKDIEGYDEIRTKKTDPDSPIDSVVAKVKGGKSAYFTKLAKRFARATRIKKMLAAEEKALKKEALEAVDEIFDAADDVYTRVIDTASLVFKVSKSSQKTIARLDEAGYLAELEKLSGMAVDELETIKNKYITDTVAKVLPRILAPKMKNEAIGDDVFGKLRKFADLASKKIQGFLANWDNSFNEIKSKIEQEL